MTKEVISNNLNKTIMKITPRQELEKLDKENAGLGFYGTPNQFALLIRSRLDERARKLMSSIFVGVLPMNERLEYNKIYNMLLDGRSVIEIKTKYKF